MGSLSKLQLSLAFADVILTGKSPQESEQTAHDQKIADPDFLERGFSYHLSDGQSALTWHQEARRLRLVQAQPLVRRHFWEKVKQMASIEVDLVEVAELLEAAREAARKKRVAEAVHQFQAADRS